MFLKNKNKEEQREVRSESYICHGGSEDIAPCIANPLILKSLYCYHCVISIHISIFYFIMST